MSLLTEASLVITPNAVKEGKLFSIIPTDGSGDLTVVRATTATRVNSDGLIEDCPYNLASYSEQFESTSWIKQSTTIVQDFAISPNGTEDADLCYPNSDGNFRGFRQLNTTSTGLRAKSIFAKQSGKSKFFIRFDNGAYVTFDLENGTIFQNTTGYVATMEDYGNGWYRCYAQSNIETSATSMYIAITDSSGYPSVTANGTDGILFWGAQDESGSLKEYFPTTDRLDVPRLDYTNSSCPSILVEPQRTNLLLRSNELSTAPNVLDNVTGTSNFYVSPDGSINAIKLAETVVNDRHGFYQYFNVTAQTYTISVFTKQIGRRYISLMSDFTGTNSLSFFDLQEKVVVSNGTGFTCSIEEYSDGWFRLSATVTASAGLKYIIFGGSTNGTTNTYIGNTSTFMTFYGFQLEAGSNATSYIPTVASTVTRNADVISKTGIADLIGQTEGTIFSDINLTFLNSSLNRSIVNLFVNDANTSDLIRFRVSGANFGYDIRNSGVIQSNILSPVYTIGRYKLAIIYKNNYAAFFINGVKIGEDLSVSIPIGLNVIRLGTFNAGAAENLTDSINSTIIYKTALTDEECIALTTL